MVTFRDPIHGVLVFDGVIEELIMTEEFQRLADVKQLGLTDKVYPGANHTRFSHSLGVCYLVGKIAEQLRIPKKDALLLQVAGLLHDIGHYDFSHALEQFAPYDHEENGRRIILGKARLPGRRSGQIAAVLRKHGIDAKRIIQLLHKEGSFPAFYYSILSDPVIDADRMDYLKRDTYCTGAIIGEIDIDRLLSVLAVNPLTKQLGILQKGIPSLEQFLVARMHMYQQVYMHPDTEAGETMLRRAVQASGKAAMPLLYGDGHLIARLAERGTPLARSLVSRIRAGKRAYYPCVFSVDGNGQGSGRETGQDVSLRSAATLLLAQERSSPGSVERKILKRSGLKAGDVLVTFPGGRKSHPEHPHFPVLLERGGWANLFNIAPIARTTMGEGVSRTLLVVYAAPECQERARRAVEALLRESA